MANKPAMSYVPPFILQDLPWYEGDVLMAWHGILTDTSVKQELLTLISSTNNVVER